MRRKPSVFRSARLHPPAHSSHFFYSAVPQVFPSCTQNLLSASLFFLFAWLNACLPDLLDTHRNTNTGGSGFGYGCTEAACSSLEMFLIYNSWHQVLASACWAAVKQYLRVLHYAEGDTDRREHSNSWLRIKAAAALNYCSLFMSTYWT